jgi:hypothetical protein
VYANATSLPSGDHVGFVTIDGASALETAPADRAAEPVAAMSNTAQRVTSLRELT